MEVVVVLASLSSLLGFIGWAGMVEVKKSQLSRDQRLESVKDPYISEVVIRRITRELAEIEQTEQNVVRFAKIAFGSAVIILLVAAGVGINNFLIR